MTSSPSTMLTLALLVAAILAILWFVGRGRGGKTPDAGMPPEARPRDSEVAGRDSPAQDAVAPVTAMEAPALPPAPPPTPVPPASVPPVSIPPVTTAPEPVPAPKPARKTRAAATAKAPAPETAAEKAPAKTKAAPKPKAEAAKTTPAATEPPPKPKRQAPAPDAPPPSAPKAAAVTAIGIPGAVGAPDDLLVLKGVGPKLGALLGTLEIARFDQIAAWGPAEIAIVDEHLGAFKGRIARDAWVEQAGFLARGDIAGYEAKFGKLEGGN